MLLLLATHRSSPPFVVSPRKILDFVVVVTAIASALCSVPITPARGVRVGARDRAAGTRIGPRSGPTNEREPHRSSFSESPTTTVPQSDGPGARNRTPSTMPSPLRSSYGAVPPTRYFHRGRILKTADDLPKSSATMNLTRLGDVRFGSNKGDSDSNDEKDPKEDREHVSCKDLQDEATFRYGSDPSRDCVWVAEYPIRRCRKIDPIRNQKTRVFCPLTCHKECRVVDKIIDDFINNNNVTGGINGTDVDTHSAAPSGTPTVSFFPSEDASLVPTAIDEGVNDVVEEDVFDPSLSPSALPTTYMPSPGLFATAAPTVEDDKRNVSLVTSNNREQTFGTTKWILLGVFMVLVLGILVGTAAAQCFRCSSKRRTRRRRIQPNSNKERAPNFRRRKKKDRADGRQQQQEQSPPVRTTDRGAGSIGSTDSCSCYLQDDYGVEVDYDVHDCWSVSVVSVLPPPPVEDVDLGSEPPGEEGQSEHRRPPVEDVDLGSEPIGFETRGRMCSF